MEWAEYIDQKYSSLFFSQFLKIVPSPTRVPHTKLTPYPPTSSFTKHCKPPSRPIYKHFIYPDNHSTPLHSYKPKQNTLKLTEKEKRACAFVVMVNGPTITFVKIESI